MYRKRSKRSNGYRVSEVEQVLQKQDERQLTDPPAVAHEAPTEAPKPAPVQRKPDRFHYPTLDGLRFFAFLGIFIVHTFNIEHYRMVLAGKGFLVASVLLRVAYEVGGFGLPLFFLMSAYLNVALLGIEKERKGWVNLRRFYYRRGLRVWPLYFFYLALAVSFGYFNHAFHVSGYRLLALILLAANWYYEFVSLGPPSTLHLWSISVEEQFYLLIGPVLRYFGRRTLLWSSIVLLVGSLFVLGWLRHRGNGMIPIRFNSCFAATYFATGTLLAMKLDLRNRIASLRVSLPLIVGGTLLWFFTEWTCRVMTYGPPPSPLRVVLGNVLCNIGCVLLMCGFLYLPTRWMPRFFSYLGRISFGLYVYQLFAYRIAVHFIAENSHVPGRTVIPALILTTIMASLSYAFIEKPFLKLKNKFEFVKTGTE